VRTLRSLSGYSDLPPELLGLVDAFVKKGQAATVLVEELKRVIRMGPKRAPSQERMARVTERVQAEVPLARQIVSE